MSATLNAELFSGYFSQSYDNTLFHCLNLLPFPSLDNAPMYKIQNVAFPVAEYFLEDILKMTRYKQANFLVQLTAKLFP